MEENIQEVKRPNCMSMPVGEDEETEGHTEPEKAEGKQ